MPGAAAFERWEHRGIPNPITINLPPGGEARMKLLGHKPALHDADGGRQEAVERRNPAIRRIPASRQVRMRALRQGMDTSVGSSGTMDANRLGTDALEGGLQPILNRAAVRLALPTGERRPIVGNDQLEARPHLVARGNFSTALLRALNTVEIPLQDHLRGDLIDNVSGITGRPTAVAQSTSRCDRSETLIPGQ